MNHQSGGPQGVIERIVSALGGAQNIVELEPCVTRLRVQVVDPDLLDRRALAALPFHGYSAIGTAVQIIVGPTAEFLADDVAESIWED
ncbi:PTS transporter subunit EIIB [Devriesea agamarum]|uniref:PTS transporter subunit EIIB n=1 Tax=Devriesea agamarum TaxID=472569 RepID=UPI00071CBBFB|nr:PTS transporter subunit EIIB [Devriesea agamarum]